MILYRSSSDSGITTTTPTFLPNLFFPFMSQGRPADPFLFINLSWTFWPALCCRDRRVTSTDGLWPAPSDSSRKTRPDGSSRFSAWSQGPQSHALAKSQHHRRLVRRKCRARLKGNIFLSVFVSFDFIKLTNFCVQHLSWKLGA